MFAESDRSQYWFEIAEYDLETARVMLSGGRFLYVGFMCHQTIEKALKGCFYQTQHQTPPYKHNLTVLSDKCGLLPLMSDDQKALLDLLEPMQIEARYPTYKQRLLDSLTADRCQMLITQTEVLLTWIRGMLQR